jgi:GDP-L-fucose synthase
MWGTGSPRREFLHVDDLAEACYFLMNNYNETGFVNVGSGEDISILELARMIKEIVGYKGDIVADVTKPDGTPRKLMDVSKIKSLGWSPTISLEDGIRQVFQELEGSDFKFIREAVAQRAEG